jgi:hypothetical protein
MLGEASAYGRANGPAIALKHVESHLSQKQEQAGQGVGDRRQVGWLHDKQRRSR